MKKVILLALLALLLTLFVGAAQAQDTLTPDTPVTGEITDAEFALKYTFEGTADQVVILSMVPVETLGDLNNPAIILRDPAGQDLVRYDGFGSTVIVWQLPEDGVYTVVATRTDDSSGTSVGEFTLTLTVAAELTLATPISGSISNNATQYFVYRGADPFVFEFTRSGDFAPEFTVNTIDTDITPGTLDMVAVLGGRLATRGSIGDIPGETVYVIRITEALFDFYFEDVTANYTLQLTAVPQ